ncbi:MAG: glycosyltransferase family 39 protein [Anaerolineae bacterium]|nr:glycosyltransferase family 39 protein [Anaerolineae bacterium]
MPTADSLTWRRLYGRSASHVLSLNPLAVWGAIFATWLAFGLRVWSLGDASLFYDEAVDVSLAASPVDQILSKLAESNLHPPLHFLWLHTWLSLVGITEFTARFASLIPAVLLVPLIFAVVREVMRDRSHTPLLLVGLPATLLVATSRFLLYYAQEARMYSLTVFWSTLAVLTLLRALRLSRTAPETREGRWAWVYHGLALAGMLYTLYLSVFLLPALALAALLTGWFTFRRWLTAALLAAMLYLPWLPSVIKQAQRLMAHPDYPAAALQPLSILGAMAADFLATDSRWVMLVVGLTVFAALGWSLGRRRGTRDQAIPTLLVILAAGLPMLGTAILASFMPKFAPRYAIVAAPMLYLAACLGLFHLLWGRGLVARLGYTALLAGAVLFSGQRAWGAAQTAWLPQEDARGLGAYLTDRAADDHLVLFVENALDAVAYYYRGEAPTLGLHVEFNFQEGAERLTQALSQHPKRVWLALWHNEFADPTGMVIAELTRRSDRPPSIRREFRDYTLMRFDLRDWSPVAAIPTPQLPIGAAFGDQLTLVGADRLDLGPGALRWILYWRAEQPIQHDLAVAVQLKDAGGEVKLTHNQSPSTPYLATAGFPPGVTLRGLTQVSLPADLKPQRYEITALVWDITAQRNLEAVGADGHPLGIAVSLGHVDIGPTREIVWLP